MSFRVNVLCRFLLFAEVLNDSLYIHHNLSIGTVWPIISKDQIFGLDSFRYGILIFIIPWAVTGVCLLFPKLTLATFAADEKVTKISVALNSAVSALVRGFCAADFADLYTAEVITDSYENINSEHCIISFCYIFFFFKLIFTHQILKKEKQLSASRV